jgi:hypothetical protein
MELLKLTWKFCLHNLFSTSIFVGIGTAAVSVHWFTEWLDHQGISAGILLGFQTLEYFVFAVDGLAYAVVLLIFTSQFLRDIWKVANAKWVENA